MHLPSRHTQMQLASNGTGAYTKTMKKDCWVAKPSIATHFNDETEVVGRCCPVSELGFSPLLRKAMHVKL